MTNSTALATGSGSRGIVASYMGLGGGKYTVDVTNTIAQGSLADLYTSGSVVEYSEIVASHSNFDKAIPQNGGKIVDAEANQSAAPGFVDAGGGNYAEASGSPTIDAGVVGPGIGALDLDGNPRNLGQAVDIGAFEFVAPAAPAPPAGQIQSLLLSPSTFVAANLGGAVISKKRGRKRPVGTSVAYELTAPSTVTFTVERRAAGRRAGKRCVKRTRANRQKAKCTLLRPVRGSFTHAGGAGANIFKFAGRIGGRTLRPGRYRLVGSAGGSGKRAGFRIVR